MPSFLADQRPLTSSQKLGHMSRALTHNGGLDTNRFWVSKLYFPRCPTATSLLAAPSAYPRTEPKPSRVYRLPRLSTP